MNRSRNLSESAIANIQENKITGTVLLQLTQNDMKEVAPLLWDRILLRNLIKDKVCLANPHYVIICNVLILGCIFTLITFAFSTH